MRIVNVENGQGYEFENSRDYYVNLYNELDWTKELDQAIENAQFSFKNYIESDLVSLDDLMENMTSGDTVVNIDDNVKEDVIKFIKENNYEGYQAKLATLVESHDEKEQSHEESNETTTISDKDTSKMTVKFDEVDANNCDVLVNGDDYGTLTLDEDQGAWVLWPISINDGVTYFEDLEETKESITDEIEDYSKIKLFLEGK